MGDGWESDLSATLYVGHNLPESITKDHILQHFKTFVPDIDVLKSTVITNKAGKRHCKLVFTNDVAAEQAISQMNGTQIRGFKLHVNRWRPPAAGNQSTDLCTVILRGIPNTVDDSLLRPLCEAYGKLTHLEVNRDKGTAVISYPSPEVAATASSYLNGMQCGGGTLSVVSSASKGPLNPRYVAPAPSLSREVSPSSIGPQRPGYSMPHKPLVQGSLPLHQGTSPPLQGRRSPLHGHGPPLQSNGPPLQGHGPPLQGHGAPLHGRGPPLQGHGPPLHGHGSLLQGHGPPLQGHGLPPQAYGTFTQVQHHSRLVSIKISNIHPSITDGELKRILSVVPSAEVVFHATPGSKPNYAHVNCAVPADVNRVMEILKDRKFNGMPVSVKTQKGKFSVPSSPVHAAPPVDMQAPVSVKVTRLPKSVTEEQLHGLIRSIQGVSSVALKTVPTQEHNYAYINCENGFAAEQVAQNLNGMQLLGSTIKATLQQSKKTKENEEVDGMHLLGSTIKATLQQSKKTKENDEVAGMQLLGSTIKATLQQSKKTKENEEVDAPGADTAEEGQEMSQDLYDFFQHRFHKEIATLEASGGILQYSEGFISVRGPEAEVNAFYKNFIKPVKDGSQLLTPDQWGQLMAAKNGATTLFQELASPFLHNPNLKLERRENPFTLVIVGFQEAVDAATSHFFSKMNTKMVVNR